MKLISWNVNGIRACVRKGFLDYFQEVDADVFCIQETKAQEGQIDLRLEGYYQYWNYAVKKAIPEQLFLQSRSLYRFHTVWIKNRKTKDVSLRLNLNNAM